MAGTVETLLLVALSLLATEVKGHGRLMEPPARNVMWRFGYKTHVNYEDNMLHCGGFNTQWYINGGKCGICGDSYSQPQPRDYEAGGRYATGTIVQRYTEGQIITTTTQITVNHGGWMEFRICPNNDIHKEATQDCLDRHVLTMTNGSTRYYIPRDRRATFDLTVSLVLPRGLTCSQCVVQWLWNGASNNNCNYYNKCCDCGPQEQFVNCADVAIAPSIGGNGQPSTPTTTTRASGGNGHGFLFPSGFQRIQFKK